MDKLIYKFQRFLQDISSVNALIGDVDVGGNDLPVWTIDLEEDWEVIYQANTALVVNFNVNCTLWMDRKNTDKALKIMSKTLKSINTFDKANGMGIGVEVTDVFPQQKAIVKTELTTNNIKISFPFRLNTIIQE